MEWRNRDWIWVVGILIGIIIILIATIFAKNKGIEINFSIISSAVSIALALVAIFFALKQDSDSRRVNENLSGMLRNVVAEVGAVKSQVDKITDKDINHLKETAIKEVHLDEQKSNYSQEEVNSILSQALDKFSEEFKVLTNENNAKKNRMDMKDRIEIKLAIKEILNTSDFHFTAEQIQDRLINEYKIYLPIGTLKMLVNEVLE